MIRRRKEREETHISLRSERREVQGGVNVAFFFPFLFSFLFFFLTCAVRQANSVSS